MQTILLIRHGETDWNAQEIFRGRADVDLNKNGLRQAELVASYLNNVRLTDIYTSPLKRAAETAAAIALKHSLQAYLSPEMVKTEYPSLYTEWLRRPGEVTLPHGESLDDVRERVKGLMSTITMGGDGTFALVSHLAVFKVLICELLGLDNSHYWSLKMDTGGVTTFEFVDGKFVLVRHNDTSFLR